MLIGASMGNTQSRRRRRRKQLKPDVVRLPDIIDPIWEKAQHNHQPQIQSPLFGVLPPEIRNEIFALALAEYEDMSKPYKRDTYYWRPGSRGPRRIDVSLLRTCKRVWLETRWMPFQAVEGHPMAFYIGQPERRPPEHTSNLYDQTPRTQRMLVKHWARLNTIQVFIQGFTQQNIGEFFEDSPLQPSTVILTTRYTDWLWWERKHPLFLDEEQMRSAVLLPLSVTKVIMEFEMIASREQELNKLLNQVFRDEQMYRWYFYSQPKKTLRIIHPEDPWRYVEEWKWDGPTKFDGKSFEHHPPGDTMTYVVKSVSWEAAYDS